MNIFTDLQMEADRIQNYLGFIGKIDLSISYGVYRSNTDIILNTIANIKNNFFDKEMINYADYALLRYLGKQKKRINLLYSYIKNPLIWFREGIRWVVALPINLLFWFGILSQKDRNKSINSKIMGTITLIAAILSIVTATITIYEFYKGAR